MRLPHAALVAVVLAPALVAAQDNLGSYEDRLAVEDVMARYVWTVDSLDADGYVAVFTEDASSTRTAASARGARRSARSSRRHEGHEEIEGHEENEGHDRQS